MFGRACQVTVISRDEISHAGPLMPRLDSSSKLLESIVIELECRLHETSKINAVLLCNDEPHPLEDGLHDERMLYQTVIALGKIQSKIHGISALPAIPAALASAIPAIRTLSSGLFELAPESSQKLCELSVSLGSIVADSAILTCASCNFGTYNIESGRLLDEAKLIADSKIDKQYPNLENAKTDST